MEKLFSILEKFYEDAECDDPDCPMCKEAYVHAAKEILNLLQSNDQCRYCGGKFHFDKDSGMFHHNEADCNISSVMFTKEDKERRV